MPISNHLKSTGKVAAVITPIRSAFKDKCDEPGHFCLKLDIEELSFSFSNLRVISNLVGLSSLRKLQLDNNKISTIENLAHLTELTWLDLSFNQITRIEGLSTLTALKDLSFTSNSIDVIENLQQLTNLEILCIGSNRITQLAGVSSLRPLHKLRCLTLSGNPIASEGRYRQYVLAWLPWLRRLDYRHVHAGEADKAVELFQGDMLADVLAREQRQKEQELAAIQAAEHRSAFQQWHMQSVLLLTQQLVVTASDSLAADIEEVEVAAAMGAANLSESGSRSEGAQEAAAAAEVAAFGDGHTPADESSTMQGKWNSGSGNMVAPTASPIVNGQSEDGGTMVASEEGFGGAGPQNLGDTNAKSVGGGAAGRAGEGEDTPFSSIEEQGNMREGPAGTQQVASDSADHAPRLPDTATTSQGGGTRGGSAAGTLAHTADGGQTARSKASTGLGWGISGGVQGDPGDLRGSQERATWLGHLLSLPEVQAQRHMLQAGVASSLKDLKVLMLLVTGRHAAEVQEWKHAVENLVQEVDGRAQQALTSFRDTKTTLAERAASCQSGDLIKTLEAALQAVDHLEGQLLSLESNMQDLLTDSCQKLFPALMDMHEGDWQELQSWLEQITDMVDSFCEAVDSAARNPLGPDALGPPAQALPDPAVSKAAEPSALPAVSVNNTIKPPIVASQEPGEMQALQGPAGPSGDRVEPQQTGATGDTSGVVAATAAVAAVHVHDEKEASRKLQAAGALLQRHLQHLLEQLQLQLRATLMKVVEHAIANEKRWVDVLLRGRGAQLVMMVAEERNGFQKQLDEALLAQND